MHLYIRGDGLSTAMRKMLQELDLPWTITFHETHGTAEAPREDEVAAVSTADMILMQPDPAADRGEPSLSLAWVKANKKADCRLFVFCPWHFTGIFPDLICLGPELDLTGIYHNVNLIELFLSGFRADQIKVALRDKSLYAPAFLESEWQRSLAELDYQESLAGADLRSLDLVRRGFPSKRLFNTVDHPTRTLLAQLLNRFLAQVGVDQRLPEAGEDYLGLTIHTPIESVLDYFGLEIGPLRGIIRVVGEDMTWDAYVDKVVDHYEQVGSARLRGLFERNKPAQDYLRRYHVFHPRPTAARLSLSSGHELRTIPTRCPPVATRTSYAFNLAETRDWMCAVSGIGKAEAHHRWTNGPRAAFTFVLPASCPENLSLTLRLSGCVYPRAPTVTGDVSINGVSVGTVMYEDADGVKDAVFDLPPTALGPGRAVEVEIFVRDPRPPFQADDGRQLGFNLLSLVLFAASNAGAVRSGSP